MLIKIYQQIGWRVTFDLFSRGSFVVVTIIIARVLGVEEFGKFAYALSLAQFAYIFTDLGMNIQMAKELGESRGSGTALWVDYLELKIFLSCLGFILFVLVSPFLWKWNSSWILIFSFLWMAGNSFLDFNQFICNGLSRMDIAGQQILIQRSGVIIASVLALLVWPTLQGILIGMALGSLGGSFCVTLRVWRQLNLTPSFHGDYRQWSQIVRRSVPNAVAATFGTWYFRLGVVVVIWIWGTHAAGEYSAAFRIYETSYIIPAAMMGIGMPYLSEAYRKGFGALKKIMSYLIPGIAFVAFAWSLLLCVLSPTIIHLIFGDEFKNASGILRIFSMASFFIYLNYFVTYMMVVINKQKRLALHTGLAFMGSLVLYFYLVPVYHAKGAAMTILLTEILVFIQMLAILAINFRDYSKLSSRRQVS